jgi:hypothetical protein
MNIILFPTIGYTLYLSTKKIYKKRLHLGVTLWLSYRFTVAV